MSGSQLVHETMSLYGCRACQEEAVRIARCCPRLSPRELARRWHRVHVSRVV
jgi:hypothetical protein